MFEHSSIPYETGRLKIKKGGYVVSSFFNLLVEQSITMT